MSMKVVYKPSDTARIGTSVAVADPHLAFAIEPATVYLIRGQLFFRGSTAGDLKWGLSAGGATLVRGGGTCQVWTPAQSDTEVEASTDMGVGAITAARIAAGSTMSMAMTTGAYWMPFKFSVMIETGGIGGTFSVVWAQNSADAINPATLLAGSLVSYEALQS